MLSKRMLLATALVAAGAGLVPFAVAAQSYPTGRSSSWSPTPPVAAPTRSPA